MWSFFLQRNAPPLIFFSSLVTFHYFFSLSCFLAPRVLFYKPCSTIWHLLITVSFSSYRHCAVTHSVAHGHTQVWLNLLWQENVLIPRLDPCCCLWAYIVGIVGRYEDARQNVLSVDINFQRQPEVAADCIHWWGSKQGQTFNMDAKSVKNALPTTTNNTH